VSLRSQTVAGLTPTDVNLLELAIGAGIPLRYYEFGLQNCALLKRDIPEPVFRELFLRTCNRGLLTWADAKEGRDHFKHRRYVVTDAGWMALADYLIAAEKGDYHYYKNFDGTSDSLKKFEKNDVEIQFKDRKKGISLKELLSNMPPKVRKRWMEANPRWQSAVV
jgi:hypothetical protein